LGLGRIILFESDVKYLRIYPLSETAIVLEWENDINHAIHSAIQSFNGWLLQNPFEGMVEMVPAYHTLTVFHQPRPNVSIISLIHDCWKQYEFDVQQTSLKPPNTVLIPVCYDAAFGPDLAEIAQIYGITTEKAIEIHQNTVYNVYMMGFLPGFPYMGVVDAAIATPRKSSPRALVEAGSVGIAGNQTGIYPLDSPGGWQIIGRTPLRLFDREKEHPFLFKTGDHVQFYSISKEAYLQLLPPKKDPLNAHTKAQNPDIMVVKPGVFSTIQDQGRFGFLAYGVPNSGAMDLQAHHWANALVGNTPDAATIECTMGGLTLQFCKDMDIAITGAGMALLRTSPISYYHKTKVFAGDLLEIRFNNQGLRTYIAVQGGFDGATIMGSQSVCHKAGIGQPLLPNMPLYVGTKSSSAPKEVLQHWPIPIWSKNKKIRILHGPEFDWMTTESQRAFFDQNYTLSNRCDRMGLHLQGEVLHLGIQEALRSTAVAKGTIQLTPSGQLIVLMSDCQTTGGYPRVGQVAAVDLPILAQAIPNENIHFQYITHDEAYSLYLAQQAMIDALFH
jgi:KipI family sensor histidine kinase inhibitor